MDDTTTECSGDYRDIDFNRDSYYFSGSDILIIPELPESEEVDIDKVKAEYEADNRPLPNMDDVDQDKENEYLDETPKNKKKSFVKRIFKKRDTSKERNLSNESPLRETSVEKVDSKEPSVPRDLAPNDPLTFATLADILERKPLNDSNDRAIRSNTSRQSPVNIVYGTPPDIRIEECTTLPRTADELAQKTSSIILDDVLNSILYPQDSEVASEKQTPEPPPVKEVKTKKNLLNKFSFNKKSPRNEQKRAVSLEPSSVSPVDNEESGRSNAEEENKHEDEDSVKPSTSGKAKPSLFKNKFKFNKKKKSVDNSDSKSFSGLFKRNKKAKSEEPCSREVHDEHGLPKPFFVTKYGVVLPMPESEGSTSSHDGVNCSDPMAVEIPIGLELPPDFDMNTEPYEPNEPIPLPLPREQLIQQSVHATEHNVPSPRMSPTPFHVMPTIAENNSDQNSLAIQNDMDQIEEDLLQQAKLYDYPVINLEPPSEDAVVSYSISADVDYEDSFDKQPSATKTDKLKNLMGSFKSKMNNFKLNKKSSSQQPQIQAEYNSPEPVDNSQEVEIQPESVDLDFSVTQPESKRYNIFRETNLDDESTKVKEIVPHQPNSFEVESTGHPDLESAQQNSFDYDGQDEDGGDVEPVHSKSKIGLLKKKMKRKKKTPKVVEELPPSDEPKEEASWSFNKNRQRLQQFRNRAAESFNQFADKIKKKRDRSRSKSKTNDYSDYDYDFKVASDSELSPGTGVDSLRRSKIYQDLVDSQERVELYMSPVRTFGPHRPPRQKDRSANVDHSNDHNQSMPSLSAVRRGPRPPRPPPPRNGLSKSSHSVPAIITDGGDEISLSTSMCSLWTRMSSRKRAKPTRQRVPADIYYKNIRLGYRPKKSYVDHLARSEMIYSVLPLARSCSLGQLPVPPARKSKSLYGKRGVLDVNSSPPPPPSRASLASNYEPLANAKKVKALSCMRDDYLQDVPIDKATMDLHSRYCEHHRCKKSEQDLANQDPLNWEPFTWKVKRCRSLTELNIREKFKQQRCCQERSPSPQPAEEQCVASQCNSTSATPHKKSSEESYSKRFFSWLSGSLTSLDKLGRSNTLSPKVPKSSQSPYDYCLSQKPPRPPLPNVSRNPKSSASLSYFSDCSFPVSTYNDSIASAYSNDFTIPDSSARKFATRPLPAPPVPPRPKQLPAHYQSKLSSPVETRDCSVDTSDPEFSQHLLRNKGTQVFLSSTGRLSSTDSQILNHNGAIVTDLDDEEEQTIREDKPLSTANNISTQRPHSNELDSLATITSQNTVYLDARSRFSDSSRVELPPLVHPDLPHLDVPMASQQVEPKLVNEWSDDDTLNDDISSLSSNYQSVSSTFQNAPETSSDEHRPATSWLHREQQRRLSQQQASERNVDATSTTTLDTYDTANDINLLTSSNRSSLFMDEENNFEAFQSQFSSRAPEQLANEDEAHPLAESPPQSDRQIKNIYRQVSEHFH